MMTSTKPANRIGMLIMWDEREINKKERNEESRRLEKNAPKTKLKNIISHRLFMLSLCSQFCERSLQ